MKSFKVKEIRKKAYKDLETEITAFCELNNSLESRAFFEEMERASLLRLDWPEKFGGRGWDRWAQLIVIKTLALHQCPIFPEALSMGAPLVINLSPAEDKVFLLENLITNVSTWRIHRNSGNEGIFFDQEDSSLYVIAQREKYPLGENGLAEEYLSRYFSTGCLLQQWLSGILLSKNLSRTIKGSNVNEIIEEEINFRAMERLFLVSENDTLQALSANSGRTKTHQIITSLIGYEGLLKKASEAGSNEPENFRRERLFLESIESQISLNEILMKDHVYEESLANDEK
tara:strand:+ start:376 stop:1236 length:861 start_codon:yes stop_codon:yes gene_type:complete